MKPRQRLFELKWPSLRPALWGDAVVLLGLAAVLYFGVSLGRHAPQLIHGPQVSRSPSTLALYTFFSMSRMGAAYVLSMLFTLVYGYAAARNRKAELVLLPLLDVLQSVPILSFLPVILLSLSAVLPIRIGAELASVILIFTSQAWNLTFAWYQSLTTEPGELKEASYIFRFNPWMRLKTLQLPFAAISLIWNSMMSWAGGWFFLMAAEIFTVGNRNFQLPGIGSYLKAAADAGDLRGVAVGLGVLVLVIVALDQFVWRPLLAWADHFRLDTVEGEEAPTSWFYDAIRSSALIDYVSRHVTQPASERLDQWVARRFQRAEVAVPHPEHTGRTWIFAAAVGLAIMAYALYRGGGLLMSVPGGEWGSIGVSLLATLVRVIIALSIALAWTIPVGLIIGTKPRLATWLQPMVQILASIPATALFPVLLLFLLRIPGGLNIAAVLLMLMGTQWYLLFNIIAGASAIPQDLKYTADLIGMTPRQRWWTLNLPALFPYIITGSITASGGAWNASIVAEYIEFGGKQQSTTGVGAMIAHATAAGDYPLLLAGTLSMIVTVVVINRFFWRRLYRLASERYRME
jgi:NitT/TauT family transport system permease protein